MTSRAAVLMYHRVADTETVDRYTVSLRQFERQMRYLASHGFNVVGLNSVVDRLVRGAALPAKTVAITFDDGFEATSRLASAILRQRGFQATFFLVAGFMGRRAEWDSSARGAAARLMGWDDAGALVAQGFIVGSHTRTHPDLSLVDDTRAADEIRGSRDVIEKTVGVRVRFFAYPYGRYDARIRRLVLEAGYAAACSTDSGFNNATTDLYALRRLEVFGGDSLLTFARKLRFGANDVAPRDLWRYYTQRTRARLLRT